MRKRATTNVSVAFDADIELVELFNHARQLDPKAMPWVRSIRTVAICTDRARVTLEISHNHYAYVLAGMDGVLNHVPLAIEQKVLIDALDVVEELDPVADQEGEETSIAASKPEDFSSYNDDWDIPF